MSWSKPNSSSARRRRLGTPGGMVVRKDNISSRLKHRIAQMLVSSSCITASIINFSDKTSQEPVFPSSNRRAHHRGKLVHRQHRMAPVVQVSIDCSGRRSIHAPGPSFFLTTEEEKKRNRKKERRVLETGVGEERKCPPASPSPPSNDDNCSHSKENAMAEKKDEFVSENKKLFSNRCGNCSSSSIGSNDVYFDCSSSEEEEGEATGTLFSSRNFSSNSLEFYRPSSYKKTTKNKESTRPPPRKGGRHVKDSWDEGNNSQPLISVSSREKKEKLSEARSGFAVVKRSDNFWHPLLGFSLRPHQLQAARTLPFLSPPTAASDPSFRAPAALSRPFHGFPQYAEQKATSRPL